MEWISLGIDSARADPKSPFARQLCVHTSSELSRYLSSGAQLNDLVTINNKVVVGDYFDTQIFTHNVQFSQSVALAVLNAVTFNASSIATAEAIVNAYVQTAPSASQAAMASQAEVNVVGISPSHDLVIAA